VFLCFCGRAHPPPPLLCRPSRPIAAAVAAHLCQLRPVAGRRPHCCAPCVSPPVADLEGAIADRAGNFTSKALLCSTPSQASPVRRRPPPSQPSTAVAASSRAADRRPADLRAEPSPTSADRRPADLRGFISRHGSRPADLRAERSPTSTDRRPLDVRAEPSPVRLLC